MERGGCPLSPLRELPGMHGTQKRLVLTWSTTIGSIHAQLNEVQMTPGFVPGAACPMYREFTF
jgi:hypothetical protein